MGVFKDILDTIKAANIEGYTKDYLSQKRYSSISKRSMDGTLQFPVLVSRSIDIDTLQIVTKALERQYSSFVQIVLSMSPIMNVDKERNISDYLNKFHQNTDVKTDIHDIGNAIIKDNYTCYTNEHNYLFACICEGATPNVINDNKKQLTTIFESLNIDKLNDKFIPKNNIYRFSDDTMSAKHNNIVKEATSSQTQRLREIAKQARNAGDYATELQAQKALISAGQYHHDRNELKQTQKAQRDLDKQKLELQKQSLRPKLRDTDVSFISGGKMLSDNEVKKSNELVPTMLHLRLKMVNKDSDDVGFFDFMVGVKATMHPINSDEMMLNLIAACKNNNKFFDFMRWTSGEISFFKDFLFGISEIKDDVVSRSSGASPWWITLKRRKALSKIKNALMIPNQVLPNTTIVVSMNEVEQIKTTYGYDLMNPTFVDKIMKTYFLLGFVVVDNSTQIAHFMFDGQGNYQSVTFTGLERENSAKVDTKEILKLINKV